MVSGPVANTPQALSLLPKIDDLLRREDIASLALPRWAVLQAMREAVALRRQALRTGQQLPEDITREEIQARVQTLTRPSLRRVINATGVVLHTNLGRAPLAQEAIARIVDLAVGYVNLEYDLDEKVRGSRHHHVQNLICHLCGAEDAVVVNNNAAAVLVALMALATGRQVVVSRGELVEIGGSFRIPDVMRLSGAQLVEVGTTNKTHLFDYENAMGLNTALLLKVHRSNFAMLGFTAEVSITKLAALARRHNLPIMVDLGSGTLFDVTTCGLPPEPTVREYLTQGADLVTFSGDKLLGGPQAGIIVGKKALLDRIRHHPLMRAIRPDKLTMAALEATLEIYRDGQAHQRIPVHHMLSLPQDVLAARARSLAEVLRGLPHLHVAVVAVTSTVGGGALPTAKLPSWAVALRPLHSGSVTDLERRLRQANPPIITRIQDDHVLLDVRTILVDEFELTVQGVRDALTNVHMST